MTLQLRELIHCWMAWGGLDAGQAPSQEDLEAGFGGEIEPCRPGAEPHQITAWEHRHGYALPAGLRAWLILSNGLYQHGPLIHPISAIGPMVIFSKIPTLVVQPESWFELGNPNVETICIDLAYRWPGGGNPIFASGDLDSGTSPRIIARSFEEWLLELLRQSGREYWLDADFRSLGDPWMAHRRYTPQPEIPNRLRPYLKRFQRLMTAHVDERAIADALKLTPADVEILFRHVQHVINDPSPT